MLGRFNLSYDGLLHPSPLYQVGVSIPLLLNRYHTPEWDGFVRVKVLNPDLVAQPTYKNREGHGVVLLASFFLDMHCHNLPVVDVNTCHQIGNKNNYLIRDPLTIFECMNQAQIKSNHILAPKDKSFREIYLPSWS